MFKRHPRVLVQYGTVPIGELTRARRDFVFSYLPGFFSTELKALPDFPEPRAGKKYRSEHLWPFFANRIPDLRREDIQELMKKNRLRESDQIELLLALGRETINNPFHLTPAY